MTLPSYPSQMAAYLAERGIPESYALSAGLRPLPADAVKRVMWGPDDEKHSVPGDALAIPYCNLDGSPMLALNGTPFQCFRVFDPRTKEQLNGGKAVRYLSPIGAGHRLYIPAMLRDLLDKGARTLVVTVGEIKAASAVAQGIACVAIGGVRLWHDPEHPGDDEQTEATPIHPELLELVGRVGRVVVLADSDARKNENVLRSMSTLAEALKAQSPDAIVAFAVVPPPEKRGAKWGLDDWLVAKGAKDVEGLINWYVNKAAEAKAAMSSGGYKALGYDDKAYYVWSNAKGTLEVLAKKELFNSALLTAVCSLRWAQASYPISTEAGRMRVDWMQLGGDLEAACVAAGPFDPDRLRGPGVWQHPHYPDCVIVNGSEIWSSTGVAVSRVGSEHIYPRIKDLVVRIDTPVATGAEVATLLEALRTWRWCRSSDPLVMLGWVGLGFVGGALTWRSHLSLTGEKGAGKSTLMGLLKRLMGPAALHSEGSQSSEPGIRQKVRHSAPALLLDEGEADGAHIARILEFLRVASSGGTMLKGTSDQTGTSFVLRAIGLIAGVHPPAMNAADASRFVRLTIKKHSDDIVVNAHPLLDHTTRDAEEIGLRLFARMVRSWPRFVAALRLVRKCIKTSEPRYVDTIAPFIASAWVLLNDADLTIETATQFVAAFELEDEVARMNDASDETALLSLITGKRVQATLEGRSMQVTVHTLIEQVAAERCNVRCSAGRELGSFGMKLLPGAKPGLYELRINPHNNELKGLLRGTRFEYADLREALARLPDAHRGHQPDRIGGDSARYVAVPLRVELPQSPFAA